MTRSPRTRFIRFC